jgi:hypothetical protein
VIYCLNHIIFSAVQNLQPKKICKKLKYFSLLKFVLVVEKEKETKRKY